MTKVLYIDMDNVLVNFRSAFPKVGAEASEQFKGREDEIPGVFALMDPKGGGGRGVHRAGGVV